jgi:hypothetical protein
LKILSVARGECYGSDRTICAVNKRRDTASPLRTAS